MIVRQVPLPAAVPPELVDAVQERLGYCSEHVLSFLLSGDGSQVRIEVDDEAHAAEAQERVQESVRLVLRAGRRLDRVVVHEHRVSPSFTGPVWEPLLAAGLLVPEGPGRVGLRGDVLAVAEALDRRFARIARQAFHAVPYQFPVLLGLPVLERARYLSAYPQHLTCAPHLRQDAEVIRKLVTRPGAAGQGGLLAALSPPSEALQPALCYHAYELLKDRPLPAPQVIITASGRCFRYESRRFATLERAWEFTMREIVFIGAQDWVEEQRQRALDQTQRLVEELGLDGWIETASDPFFVDDFASYSYAQLAHRGKYELRLTLPYSGGSLAAASFNLSQDYLGKAFRIGLGSAWVHSGCIGFGIERWTWALLAQFGPYIERWPSHLRGMLGL